MLPVLLEALALEDLARHAILQLNDPIDIVPDLARQLKIDVSTGMPGSQSLRTPMRLLQIDHSLQWIVR